MCDLDYVFDPEAPEWPSHPEDYFQVGNVTPSTVIDAMTGGTNPEQVREILDAIVAIYRANKPRPRLLDVFLAQGFAKVLDGEALTFQEAIGLMPKDGRGRPRTDERTSIRRARHVLENRLKGMSFEDAVAKAACELNTSATRVKDAWRDHNETALAVLEFENSLDDKKRTQQETARLTKIFAEKPFRVYCTVCDKDREVRVPEPRAGATLPYRPRCHDCDHEFAGPDLQPILDGCYDYTMRLRREVRRLVRGVLRQRRGPPRFQAVEWGGARYIRPRCAICGALRMIEVPAELPAPWDVKCQGCEAIFVDLRVCSPSNSSE